LFNTNNATPSEKGGVGSRNCLPLNAVLLPENAVLLPEGVTSGQLLTPAQVSSWLGIKVKTLDVWRCKGTGPAFIKRFRRIRYQAESVAQWLLSHGEHASTLQARLASIPREE
jgi:Helix-turn-helix domain